MVNQIDLITTKQNKFKEEELKRMFFFFGVDMAKTFYVDM